MHAMDNMAIVVCKLTLVQVDRAAPQQVDHVEVLPQVQHDLDLGHHGDEVGPGKIRKKSLKISFEFLGF